MADILTLPRPEFRQLRKTPFVWRRKDGLQVFRTVDDVYDDGKVWMHVSLSYPNRLPTYEDMVVVKREFIGDDRVAYQVFPDKEKHINHHPYCLHLWCCLEGPILPDFSFGGLTI